MGRNTMNAHTPRTSSYSTVGILQHPRFSRVNILFVNEVIVMRLKQTGL